MSEQVSGLLTPETVLSFVFVVAVLGFGTWFFNKGWPWFTQFLEKRQDLQHSLETKRIEIEAASDTRWQETTAQLAANFASLKEELGAFRALQHTTINSLEQLFRYVVKNGDDPDRGG